MTILSPVIFKAEMTVLLPTQSMELMTGTVAYRQTGFEKSGARAAKTV
ncbi:hypothetical protein QUF90_15930 [Desulfococcaceae bacterium HSG9]|nr:hypothetical protein [Desulfococcaceae bacterium HSG9]